jgi:hypothetical protein
MTHSGANYSDFKFKSMFHQSQLTARKDTCKNANQKVAIKKISNKISETGL